MIPGGVTFRFSGKLTCCGCEKGLQHRNFQILWPAAVLVYAWSPDEQEIPCFQEFKTCSTVPQGLVGSC
jgi:hypothetical protein